MSPHATAAATAWISSYRHGDLAFDLAGSEPRDQALLEEFLLPWCRRGETGGTVGLDMLRDESGYRALTARWNAVDGAPPGARRLPCVRLDTRTIVLEARPEADGWHLFDPEIGCHFLVDRGRAQLVAMPDERRAPMAMLGMIRELVLGHLVGRGPSLDLHAAAFAWQDRAIAVAGPKMAGKTSLLCHAVLGAGAGLIANDRLLVHLDRTPPHAVGIPTMATLRQGTLDRFPALLQRADTFPAADIPPAAGPAEPPVLLLPPRRFAGRLGARIVPEAPLAAVLLPQLASDVAGWTLARLPEDEAAAALETCLHGLAADRQPPTLFAALAAGADVQRPPAAEPRHLAAAVPVLRCRLGPDAHLTPALRLLDALEREISGP